MAIWLPAVTAYFTICANNSVSGINLLLTLSQLLLQLTGLFQQLWNIGRINGKRNARQGGWYCRRIIFTPSLRSIARNSLWRHFNSLNNIGSRIHRHGNSLHPIRCCSSKMPMTFSILPLIKCLPGMNGRLGAGIA